MADNEAFRRLIEQAQGQGGPAFSRRMASIQERTAAASDPALDLMAARAGQTPVAYLNSIAPEAAAQHQRRIERNRLTAMEPQGDGMTFPTQADLDQRYRDQQMAAQMPPIPSMPAPPKEGTSPQIGLDTPVNRQPVPRNPVPDAGSTMDAGANMDQDRYLTTGGMGGRADAPPPLPVPQNEEYLTTGMSGIYRTDSNEGIPPPPPAAGLGYGMEPANVGDQTIPQGTNLTMPKGQVIPGRPGEVQNAPQQSGLGPVAPADPAAYNPETGTRPEEARKLSFMERVFGERGSDQSKNAGKALMMAGAAIMSTPGTIGEAVGAGIQAGLLTYDEAQKALSDEAKEARLMGMEEEAHQLDMELKRLQIQRGRQAGSLAGKPKAKIDPIAQAMEIAARLEGELGIPPQEAMDRALGYAKIGNNFSPSSRDEGLLAGLE